MESLWDFSDLEIAGYANVLSETMLPSVVPPVFRLKAEPDRVFLPPYQYNSGLVCNATEVSQTEAVELRDASQITLFGEAYPARIGFELWVDRSFAPRYEAIEDVDRQLAGIAADGIREAEAALRGGDLEAAERYCGIAISANDRRLEPLAIKAAIRRRQGNRAGEALMATLAAAAIGEFGFRELVDGYFRSIAGERRVRPDQGCAPRRPMQQMAMARAA